MCLRNINTFVAVENLLSLNLDVLRLKIYLPVVLLLFYQWNIFFYFFFQYLTTFYLTVTSHPNTGVFYLGDSLYTKLIGWCPFKLIQEGRLWNHSVFITILSIWLKELYIPNRSNQFLRTPDLSSSLVLLFINTFFFAVTGKSDHDIIYLNFTIPFL